MVNRSFGISDFAAVGLLNMSWKEMYAGTILRLVFHGFSMVFPKARDCIHFERPFVRSLHQDEFKLWRIPNTLIMSHDLNVVGGKNG